MVYTPSRTWQENWWRSKRLLMTLVCYYTHQSVNILLWTRTTPPPLCSVMPLYPRQPRTLTWEHWSQITKSMYRIKQHLEQKAPHIRKFTSFLTKNSDCPYNIKFKVWNSALNAAILYSCETWITNDTKQAETPYLGSLKQLLGVRNTTCSDLVHWVWYARCKERDHGPASEISK